MSEIIAGLREWMRSLGPICGLGVVYAVTLVKERPWGTVMTAETETGRIFAKANCAGLNSEGPLLQLLAQWSPHSVVGPLAVHPTTGWFAVPDGGKTLFAADLHQDPTAWAPVLGNLAAAQRAALGKSSQLLAAGVPDFRPHTVAERLERIVEELGLVGAERARVLSMVPALAQVAVQLEQDPIGIGISHGDVQSNNLLQPPTSKPSDWGDAVVAHPFCTLANMRWSLDDPNLFSVLRDSYLSQWTDLADLDELRRIAALAELVGCVASIWTWVRVGPAGIARHPTSVPRWFDRIALGLSQA